MKVLWIFAHPEQRSLNASLRDEGLAELAAAGHQTQLADLYAMGFRPVVDQADFPAEPSEERLLVGAAQKRGHSDQTLSADILAEQEKVAWADVLVFQFPLWWFGPPAILKGWFDRVFVQGFAFGLHDEQGRDLRYGAGAPLAGKRALVVTTVGARPTAFHARGVHGHIEDVLYPLLHGTFWYAGIAALPPFVVYGADRLDARAYASYAHDLRDQLRALPDATPLTYRSQNGGDYDDDLLLHPEVAPGRTDLAAHRADPHAWRVRQGEGASAATRS